MGTYNLKKQANQGNTFAQCELGVCYYYGKGVKQSYEEAVKWYEKAANQGNTFAQCELGVCYYYGKGVKQSYEEAVKWYEKATNQGHAVAQNYLGMCYYNGEGVEQSYEEAVKWFEKAAKQKHAEAQNNLGMCYYNGEGVEQSYKEAVYWFEKAAEHGITNSQYTLGIYYFKGIGVEQSYEKAVYWFEKATEKEHAVAQSYLGTCYLHGIGIEQNFKEAERLFKEAVKNGRKEDEYNTRIFEQLQGRRIQQIKDISEEFDDKNVGAVLISPQENKDRYSHTLYDIETYKKIKKEVNKILEDVEEVNPNKDNEFDVFMKIYTKLGRIISYDYQEAEKPIVSYESSNLIGGLLEGKCVCAGYAEILRNVLLCRGIECICVFSNDHAFNQVKIGGKWYYCDLTNSIDSLYSGKKIEYCLVSKEEFENQPYRIALQNQIVYPSSESYPQKKVKKAVKRIINSEKSDVRKEAEGNTEKDKSIKKLFNKFIDRAILTEFQRYSDFLGINNNNDKDTREKSTKDSSLER